MTPVFDEIRATDLEEWAGREESKQWMPSLLRQLVLGPGAQLKQCRFLTHEEINSGGWDAVLEAGAPGLNVPEGVSGWELSRKSEKRIVEKAREDIEKRTQQPGDLIPAETTLVIVSLRVWPRRRRADGSYEEPQEHKVRWAAERMAEFKWKEIRVLDAVDMADWIAGQPGVGLWLSPVMGRNVRGARSLILHWQDLMTLSKDVSPSFFLAGRKAFVTQIEAWLSEPSQSAFDIRSWSQDDVRDALAAWWHERGDSVPVVGISPIIVSDFEAWQYLIRLAKPLLLLADGALELTSEQISAAITQGHRVVIRTSAGHTRGVGSRLEPLNRNILAEELTKCGIEHEIAWRMAGEAGGSGVALKRLLAGDPSQPEWADKSIAPRLAPIVLFGAWDGNCDADKQRIADVFGQTYEKVEKSLQPWTTANHPLLRHVGGKWRVISREDAWRWLSPHLRIEHYTRFRRSAVAVLAELNPRYDMPVDERIYAGIHKKVPIYSSRLRRAMGETLCLLGLRSPETDEGARAVDLVRGVINEIFAAAADWRLWASIDYALLFMAEAAPDLFLKALEQDVARKSPATIDLLRQSGDSLFGDHPHVEVMWALEGLMWERAWVTRAALVLARLAALDPGGNCSPRPLGVLREAFLPWLPQCCLDLADRCRLLDKIMDAEPDVAWRLFLSLLPKTHDMSSPRHRPTYRKVVAAGDNGVTDMEYWEQVTHVARRLGESAGPNPARWLELVGELNSFPPDLFDTALTQLETLAVELDAEHRAGIWEALRRKAAEHRFFAKADWAMPNESLVRIEAVAAKLEPSDPVKRLAWIFSRQRSYLPGTNCDTPYEEQESQRTAAQVAALREIAAEEGIRSIRRLAEQISEYNTGNVGFLTATHNIVDADSDILPAWLEDENASLKAFARGYAQARLGATGSEWLRRIGVDRWQPDTFGELASIFPHREETWNNIEAIGPEFSDAFWRAAGPWIHGATPEQAERVVHELIVHQRPFIALECAHSCAHQNIAIANDLLLRALDAVRTALCAGVTPDTDNSQEPKLEPYHLCEVFGTLQKSADLTPTQTDRIEQLEWFFLPILKHHGAPRLLLRRLRRDPEFFIEALTLGGYRHDEGTSADSKNLSDHERNVSQLARQLLDSVRSLPGTNGDGNFDKDAFRSWVKDVRRLAITNRYINAAEYVLGKWLLYSPVDKDGSWPCAEVCHLMTREGSDKLTSSFENAIFNNQGWPGPFAKGRILSSLGERHQAVLKLRELADKLDLEFPVVAAILRSAAKAQDEMLRDRLRDDE